MSPAEEQILRNQIAIMALLMPVNEEGVKSIQRGLACLKDTRLLLETESVNGRTVHAYPV